MDIRQNIITNLKYEYYIITAMISEPLVKLHFGINNISEICCKSFKVNSCPKGYYFKNTKQ